MERLEKLLPGFSAEITDALTELGRADLVEMIPVLTLNQVTYDAEADALYLYIRGTCELNVVEKNREAIIRLQERSKIVEDYFRKRKEMDDLLEKN